MPQSTAQRADEGDEQQRSAWSRWSEPPCIICESLYVLTGLLGDDIISAPRFTTPIRAAAPIRSLVWADCWVCCFSHGWPSRRYGVFEPLFEEACPTI